MNEKDIKKYMAFSKKSKIPLEEAVKRYALVHQVKKVDDYRVVLGLAEMVYRREAA